MIQRLRTTLAEGLLSAVLEPQGFTRRGKVFVREGEELTQAVAALTSRFTRSGGPAWFWVETPLVLGRPSGWARSFAAFQRSSTLITSLRLQELAPDLGPYLNAQDPDAVERALTSHLLPFLTSTTTVRDALAALGEARSLTRAVLLARVGRFEESRALFASAPGDPGAIRRLAASLGVDLE